MDHYTKVVITLGIITCICIVAITCIYLIVEDRLNFRVTKGMFITKPTTKEVFEFLDRTLDPTMVSFNEGVGVLSKKYKTLDDDDCRRLLWEWMVMEK